MATHPNNPWYPTAIDLFSGCGGLTSGLKQAGFKVIGAVEIEPMSVKTYKANHKDVTLWEKDIRDLNMVEVESTLERSSGKLDLLTGCPPCQGFSAIRTLNGALSINDTRDDLLLEILRFVEALSPRAVMVENVPGLLQTNIFKTFCGYMHDLGYMGSYRVVDAANYGVPQRRRRLIYLAGYRMDIPFAIPNCERISVRGAIGDLPEAGISGDPPHDIPENRSIRIMKMIQRVPKDGGSRTDLPEHEQLECHKRCNGFKDVYGRMSWDDVAPTITGGCSNPSKGRFLHPDEDRAITIREAALLQGFTREYKFPITNNKSALATMIGNALPPPLSAACAKVIIEALQDLDDDYLAGPKSCSPINKSHEY